jgi:hypothetical protein
VHASDLWLRHSGRGGSGARCKTKQVGRGYGKIWLASWLLLSLSFKEVLDLSHGSEEVMNGWRIFHAQCKCVCVDDSNPNLGVKSTAAFSVGLGTAYLEWSSSHEV